MSAIKLERVTKSYGRSRGVSDLDLTVERGELYGFIGPNGAGKSTTIRMIMQLTAPSAGSLAVLGTPLRGEQPELRRRIGYLPSEIALSPDMTGRQALELAAAAYGRRLRDTPAAAYAERLQWDMDKRVKSYSLGNRKKLGIVLSLLHTPELLILDEPTSGLDPLIQRELFDLLAELNRRTGMTVFFSTHVLSEVEKVCGRVAFIRDGKLIRVSRVDELAGKGDHIVEVRFAAEGDRREEYGLARIDGSAEYENGLHRLRSGSRLQETLSLLASLPVEDVTIRRPTVEELFMDDYREQPASEGGRNG